MNQDWSRLAAVAGRFYPDDRTTLEFWLDEKLHKTEVEKKSAHGIFAPHAGYVFSGAVAAAVYARIKIPDLVYVLCPNHTGRGSMISVWSEGEWQTPLGEIPVDAAAAAAFMRAVPGAGPDTKAHEAEHAIEVHLPFLKFLNPGVRIVPVVLGPLRREDCLRVGEGLASAVKAGPEALLVASTDMSHYISAAAAKRKDSLAITAIESGDASALYDTVSRNDISMCGFIPTTAVMAGCRALGAQQFETLAYSHSGEVTGDESSVVGYAGGIFR